MPQFKRVDEQGQPVFTRVDESGKPVSGPSPTLLESRREASKMEFEANKPQSTMLTRGREMAIGALQPFKGGGDIIKRALMGDAAGTLRDVAGIASSGGSVLKDALTGNAAGITEVAKDVVTAPLKPLARYGEAIAAGDPDAAANAAGGIISETLPAVYGVGQAVKAGASAIAQRSDAARIFNRVAGVPAGRKGAEVSMKTGQVKTNPGNAPVRALEAEGVGPLGRLKEAVFARPTPELQIKVYGELHNAGTALGDHLAQSKVPLNLAGRLPDVPKMSGALEAVGVPKQNIKSVLSAQRLDVTPTQAHALRSEMGNRINWNPNVVVDANEALKDAYFQLGDMIETGVNGVGPFNKRWQEAFLYNKALKHQLENIAAGKSVPESMVKGKLIKAAKTAGVGGGLYGIYQTLKSD